MAGDWTAARPTRLAVAAVGYGDGYPRSLGVRYAGAGERRTRRSGRQGVDGHDRHRRHRSSREPPLAGRPGRAVGRGIAGGGNRGVGGHHPLRIAVRDQPARRGQPALNFVVPQVKIRLCRCRPATGTLTATVLAGLLLLHAGAFAACKLGKVRGSPGHHGGHATDDRRPNQWPRVRFLIDSGAFYSMISRATAAQYEPAS